MQKSTENHTIHTRLNTTGISLCLFVTVNKNSCIDCRVSIIYVQFDTGTCNWINGEKDYLKNRDNWQGTLNLQQGQSRAQRGAKNLDFRARGQEFRTPGRCDPRFRFRAITMILVWNCYWVNFVNIRQWQGIIVSHIYFSYNEKHIGSGILQYTLSHFLFPGSSGSESQESKSQTDGYMDMKPGSSANSTGNDNGYMDMMVGKRKQIGIIFTHNQESRGSKFFSLSHCMLGENFNKRRFEIFLFFLEERI